MHLAQKRAIFGMVEAMEIQLRYLKSLINMPDTIQPGYMGAAQNNHSMPLDQGLGRPLTGYTTDEEDAILKREIEAARRRGEAESEAIRAQWEEQRDLLKDDSVSSLDGDY